MSMMGMSLPCNTLSSHFAAFPTGAYKHSCLLDLRFEDESVVFSDDESRMSQIQCSQSLRHSSKILGRESESGVMLPVQPRSSKLMHVARSSIRPPGECRTLHCRFLMQGHPAPC